MTYSNPYFVGRLEYWYQTNTFPEKKNLSDESAGGLGTGIGFGLEFPIELKKTYFNVEFLYHYDNKVFHLIKLGVTKLTFFLQRNELDQ